MKQLRDKKGLTLVEIIVAITILGILVIGISGMLDLSLKQLFDSGHRTRETMVVQETVDLLQAHNNATTPGYQFENDGEIVAFLVPYTTDPDFEISYQVGGEETKDFGSGPMRGWPVTITKTLANGSKTVQLSTFVVNHHYTTTP